MRRFIKKLFEKMLGTYRKKDNKVFFEENERVYENYLEGLFGTFDKYKDDAQYYNAMFTKLDQLFQYNSKAFSNLKHMSYDLVDLLTKAGKLVHKISAAYSEQIKEEEKIYSVIKLNVKGDVDALNKKLKIGLDEWGSQLIAQSRHVIDNLAGFFHYRKHENLAFSKLLNVKQETNNAYIKSSTELEKTKKKLFDLKNTEKWKVDFNKIDGDFNEMFKDYDKIKSYMLPDVY